MKALTISNGVLPLYFLLRFQSEATNIALDILRQGNESSVAAILPGNGRWRHRTAVCNRSSKISTQLPKRMGVLPPSGQTVSLQLRHTAAFSEPGRPGPWLSL